MADKLPDVVAGLDIYLCQLERKSHACITEISLVERYVERQRRSADRPMTEAEAAATGEFV
jgi:hypothetical protein